MAQTKNNPSGFLPLAQFQPHGALTRTWRFFFATAGAVMQGPNIPVPPGASVTFRPIGNAGAVNSEPVKFSEMPESVVNDPPNVVPFAGLVIDAGSGGAPPLAAV